ncbi:hypothetical protein SNEBB_009387 [Seison nebaliae]|nr:hypothetical protein SNEBB_009387 [Seison nebaliae]
MIRNFGIKKSNRTSQLEDLKSKELPISDVFTKSIDNTRKRTVKVFDKNTISNIGRKNSDDEYDNNDDGISGRKKKKNEEQLKIIPTKKNTHIKRLQTATDIAQGLYEQCDEEQKEKLNIIMKKEDENDDELTTKVKERTMKIEFPSERMWKEEMQPFEEIDDADYSEVKLVDYGKAMLRGMGWNDEDAEVKTNDHDGDLYSLRPKGLGLGVTVVTKNGKKEFASQNYEKLKSLSSNKRREKFIKILNGKYENDCARIEMIDYENDRISICIEKNKDRKFRTSISFNVEFEIVDEIEYKKCLRCINQKEYDDYKRQKRKHLLSNGNVELSSFIMRQRYFFALIAIITFTVISFVLYGATTVLENDTKYIESKSKSPKLMTGVRKVQRNLHIHILYETLCGDSHRFFQTQLQPLYDSMKSGRIRKEKLIVHLVPHGKVRKIEKLRYCQHGLPECEGNLYHACALDASTDWMEVFSFLKCTMEGYSFNNVRSISESCLKSSFNDTIIDRVKECLKSKEEEILSNNERQTEIGGVLRYIPFIRFDTDQKMFTISRSAELNLIGYLCKTYTFIFKDLDC